MTAPAAGALEACPCCGGEAATSTARTTDRDYIRLNKRDTGYGVNCISCGLNNRGIAIGYATEADAIAAWNRRTHGPALLAALRLREWRPIAEGVPEDEAAVLGLWMPSPGAFTHVSGNNYGIVARNADSGNWYLVDDGDEPDEVMRPDFWRPLPAPPTADDLARVLEQTK